MNPNQENNQLITESNPNLTQTDKNLKNILDYFNQGNAHENLKQYKEAISAYEKAIEINPDLEIEKPNDPELAKAYRFKAFNVWKEQKEYIHAIKDYDEAIKIDPKYTDYLYKGDILSELKEYQEALLAYDEAIKIKPGYAGSYLHKVIAHEALKQYKEAISAYAEAIKINPNHSCTNTLNNLMENKKLWDHQEKHIQAIEDYAKAIKINPKNDEAYHNKGYAHAELKQYEDAISAYAEAIKIEPQYDEAYFNKGNAYVELKQYEAAISAYDEAIKIDPQYAEAYFNKGNVHTEIQEYKKAKLAYKKAIEINPDHSCAGTLKHLMENKLVLAHKKYNDITDMNIQPIFHKVLLCQLAKLKPNYATKKALELFDKSKINQYIFKQIIFEVTKNLKSIPLDSQQDMLNDTEFFICLMLDLNEKSFNRISDYSLKSKYSELFYHSIKKWPLEFSFNLDGITYEYGETSKNLFHIKDNFFTKSVYIPEIRSPEKVSLDIYLCGLIMGFLDRKDLMNLYLSFNFYSSSKEQMANLLKLEFGYKTLTVTQFKKGCSPKKTNYDVNIKCIKNEHHFNLSFTDILDIQSDLMHEGPNSDLFAEECLRRKTKYGINIEVIKKAQPKISITEVNQTNKSDNSYYEEILNTKKVKADVGSNFNQMEIEAVGNTDNIDSFFE